MTLISEGSLPDLHAASQPVSRPPLYITILKYAYHRYHHTAAHFSSVKRVKVSRKSGTKSKHQRYHLYRRSCRVTTWRKNFKVFDKTLKFFVTLILEGSLPDLHAASQPVSRPPLYITILKYAYHRYHHTAAHFSSVKRVKVSRKSGTKSKHQRYHLYRRSCRVTTWRKNFKVFDKTLKFFVTLILEGSLPDLHAASQ